MGDKLHFKKCIWYVYMTQNTNDTLSPKGHKDRNNSRSPRSRIFGPCTFNNYKQEDLDNLVVLLKSIAEEYYINQEIGLNMTPHLQFCFRTKNALQFNSVIKKFPGCHMEISHNWMATVLYCKKTDTAIADNINSLKVVDDPMEGHTPYDWQSRIINCLNTKPDNFWGNDPSGSRPEKEHHFAGKVWMVKGEGWDKQKKRVDKSEVENYLKDGWIKGGPRS